MYAPVEQLRWGDVTDWPRLTVERVDHPNHMNWFAFKLMKNAIDVVGDIEAARCVTGDMRVTQIRIQPEHREGPALRVLLALIAAKAHGLGIGWVRIEPAPSGAFFNDLVALGLTPQKEAA